jgi:hypothetical protein
MQHSDQVRSDEQDQQLGDEQLSQRDNQIQGAKKTAEIRGTI